MFDIVAKNGSKSETKEILDRLSTFVQECNETNSTLDKQKVISKYPDLKKIFRYVYDKTKPFHVHSKNIKKHEGKPVTCPLYDGLFELLDDLHNRVITGNKAIDEVNGFIAENSEYKELIYNIIDKNLKCRIQAKNINKVFPDTVPEFSVSLAETYYFTDTKKKKETKINFEDGWYASRKMDGVRCIARKEGAVVTFFSRQGIPFETLNKIEKELQDISEDFVLDGEVCVEDEKGNEVFKGIMQEIRRKNHVVENPKYVVFDFLSPKEFDEKYSENCFTVRQRLAKDFFERNLSSSDKIRMIEQTKINNKEHLVEMSKSAKENGWEGLIIRKDCPYEGKRSKNMFKVKNFYDAEYTVHDIDIGPWRIINDDGIEETVETVRNVKIFHKGKEVMVGSGFSLNERYDFYDCPDKIIGKVITVSYFEETDDGSLRFPTVKYVHGDKRDT